MKITNHHWLFLLLTVSLILTYNNCQKVHYNEEQDSQLTKNDEQDHSHQLGPGQGYTLHKQHIRIQNHGSVDILFVIDNSPSMEEEHIKLAQSFLGFFSKIQDLDWRIALTTTDVINKKEGTQGTYFSFIVSQNPEQKFSFLDKSSLPSGLDPQSLFNDNIIRAGTKGSGCERGLVATQMFLEKNRNGFLRNQSNLSVIILTDENEALGDPKTSTFDGCITRSDFTPQDLKNYVEKTIVPKTFSFYSLTFHKDFVDTTTGEKCIVDKGEENGTVYEEMSRISGGINGNICLKDYTHQVIEIGDRVRHLSSQISLECQPEDLNTDGQLEIKVITAAGAFIPASFTFPTQPNNLNNVLDLNSPLEIGEYDIEYYCKTPP